MVSRNVTLGHLVSWALGLTLAVSKSRPDNLLPIKTREKAVSGQSLGMEEEHYPALLVTHSKVCLNGSWSSENQRLAVLRGWLRLQAYRAYDCVLLCDSPSRDKQQF